VAEPAPAEFDEDDAEMPPAPEAFPPGWDEIPVPANLPRGNSKPSPKDEPVGTSLPESNTASIVSAQISQRLGVEIEPNLVTQPGTVKLKVAEVVTEQPPQRSQPAIRPETTIAPRMNPFQSSVQDEHSPRMVTVVLNSTGEAVKDQRRIQRLHGAFISFPGKDHFTLHIKENGRAFLMEFPNDTTRVCTQLMEDIKKIVSENDIRIEPLQYM
jgi:hypothetical protein